MTASTRPARGCDTGDGESGFAAAAAAAAALAARVPTTSEVMAATAAAAAGAPCDAMVSGTSGELLFLSGDARGSLAAPLSPPYPVPERLANSSNTKWLPDDVKSVVAEFRRICSPGVSSKSAAWPSGSGLGSTMSGCHASVSTNSRKKSAAAASQPPLWDVPLGAQQATGALRCWRDLAAWLEAFERKLHRSARCPPTPRRGQAQKVRELAVGTSRAPCAAGTEKSPRCQPVGRVRCLCAGSPIAGWWRPLVCGSVLAGTASRCAVLLCLAFAPRALVCSPTLTSASFPLSCAREAVFSRLRSPCRVTTVTTAMRT